MKTVELVIYYEPDDPKFRGDQVRYEFVVDGRLMQVYCGDYGNSAELIFEGYKKAYQHIYGDDKVEVVTTKKCLKDWDDSSRY